MSKQKSEILKELVSKQLKTVSSDKKLSFSDMKRLCKYINGSIFDDNKCCIWKGYITNSQKTSKGTYINFYFNKKKMALHRLLYANFVENITEDYYLKFSCENKGRCCNINHLNKFKYNKTQKETNSGTPKTPANKLDFIITFD